jgi:hypothetical protein
VFIASVATQQLCAVQEPSLALCAFWQGKPQRLFICSRVFAVWLSGHALLYRSPVLCRSSVRHHGLAVKVSCVVYASMIRCLLFGLCDCTVAVCCGGAQRVSDTTLWPSRRAALFVTSVLQGSFFTVRVAGWCAGA